jgi:hypothetical protein
MPYIQGTVPVLQVFNPRSRAATLPGFDRRYLYRAAHNLARALGALHKSDYFVGDLNESNVLVTPSALVRLIDTDSFQVQEPKDETIIIYPCRVGKPEYTPRELQGQSLRKVVRKWEHDAFALAVLIFQLLLDGNHPFRARWLSPGEPPPMEERIRRGLFPYPASPEQRAFAPGGREEPPIASLVVPPPGVLGLNTLDPALANLMRRCFLEGHEQPSRRPTALEWEQTLAAAEAKLVDCERGHIYAGHLKACPICGAERRVGARSQPQPAKGAARPAAGAGTAAQAPHGTARNPRAGAAAGKRPASGASRQAPPASQSPDWANVARFLITSFMMIVSNTMPSPGAQPGPGGKAGTGARAGAGAKKAGRATWQQRAARWAAAMYARQQAGGGPRPVGPAGQAGASTTVPPSQQRCRRCGTPNQPDDIFCQKCGAILGLQQPCPKCGKPMPVKTRFCTHCDTRI